MPLYLSQREGLSVLVHALKFERHYTDKVLSCFPTVVFISSLSLYHFAAFVI